jgi:uncharacterized protein YdcH (DUF465 family)
MDEQKLKERLLEESEEFRKAYEEHQELERKIGDLRGKPHPTETDALGERELKKRKLALKDRMYRMMSEAGKGV